MAEGARAHGENNYRIGVQDRVFIVDRINHLIEHALKYAAGDRADDHLAAIRCNAGMLIWIDEHAASADLASAKEARAINHAFDNELDAYARAHGIIK